MTSPKDQEQRDRDELRAAGVLPLEKPLPEKLHEDFAAECRRQSRLIAQAETEADLLDFLDAALDDLDDWTE